MVLAPFSPPRRCRSLLPLSVLSAQKQNSWSSVVSKQQAKPFTRVDAAPAKEAAPATAAPAPASSAAKDTAPVAAAPAAKPAPKEKAAAPAPPVDPEAQIQALAKQIDQSVRETETRAQGLKTIQQEIQAISGTSILLVSFTHIMLLP